MEMQIMHHLEKGQEADAHDAIISVLFKREEHGHPLIDDLLTGKEVDLTTLVQNQPWFHYRGSHTAPPSIDFVKWFVLSKELPVTARQMAQLQDHWHESHGFTNFRIAQPLYGRKLYKNFK